MFKWWSCRVIWTLYLTTLAQAHMPAHRPIDCLPLWTLLQACATVRWAPPCFLLYLMHSSTTLSICTMVAPLWSGSSHILAPYGFLLQWLPNKLKDDRMGDVGRPKRWWCRCGVLKLNAINQWWEVKQETRCHMLLVGRWVSLERVGMWRQQMACVQACVFRPVWQDTTSKWP